MHASSLENMYWCYRKYIAGGPLEKRDNVAVLDVGSADVNGSFQQVFANAPFQYRGADMEAGPGVDIVLTDPYQIPLPDRSIDIVVSGQMMEHCEFFWRAFEEMVRILRPDGFIFLIVPSAGPIHRYPVDCYRFYPDSLGALAKHTSCVLVDSWLDERGPWRDLVGVFRRREAPALEPVLSALLPQQEWSDAPGTPEEEIRKGSAPYLDVLGRLHNEFAPAQYLEIGVRHGASLALARCRALGIDPAPEINVTLRPTTRVLSISSDDFFASPSDKIRPDLCFIDGMHLFEYALRDFMNVERVAPPGAIAVIDDILPNHPAQAARERRTRVWTGDVWRLAEVLRRHRPDLFLLFVDTAPTGLLLVAGLDRTNRTLWNAYNSLVRAAQKTEEVPPGILEREGVTDPSSALLTRVLEAASEARKNRLPPAEMVAKLRHAADDGKSLPRPRTDQPRLSVVVVSHNMARELPRTLRSLSPSMQRDIDPRDYEIILVDNGSALPPKEDELRHLIPNLVVRHLENPTVSPVPAVNFGMSLARSDLIGVCIDGARMCSPGLLAKALAAMQLHERALIGTIAFHLGPAAQMQSIKHGYDQEAEDKLLEQCGWETDGYRLYAISSFAGSSAGGWFELPAESNAFFMRAEHWRSLGGFDEGFVTPGGGLANLDIWARACEDETAEVVMLLGEATFHQVHGGIATNNMKPPRDLFREEYIRLRGRPYRRPRRQPIYFGTLPDAAKASMRASLERA